ncbi:hypothetical protein [uncultured Peptoniphilus sp.]|uniref:hypothetical protein n=1 Tax=uncultured Peptoniphilus sp. TaxID=254354 RepID=UPI002589EFDF|nr:hypothetical protein [uncultured Peptoniphilus sp.]MDU6784279.1 hypothetical protein [Peptoniphilus harei]
MSEDNNKSIDKRLAEIKKNFVNNKSSEEKTLCTFTGICSFNLLILVIVFLLLLHYKALSSDLVAKVLSALIAVIGVFAGFYYNKREKYKEIVTKERIEWLHKMQENLSEYLVLTSSGKAKDIDRDKVRKLYYEIILNINHENDKEALAAIKNYHRLVLGEPEKITLNLALTQDKKIELLAVSEGENELLFKIKDESERDKLKGLIEDEKLKDILIGEVKFKNKNKGKDKKEKDRSKEISLLREEVSEEFTEIFKKVWEDIKEEAD